MPRGSVTFITLPVLATPRNRRCGPVCRPLVLEQRSVSCECYYSTSLGRSFPFNPHFEFLAEIPADLLENLVRRKAELNLTVGSSDLSFVWIALITVVILQLSVLFTTVYLHRALTHRALNLHPLVVNIMHLHLTVFTGVIPREWAAVHRKHHHFSDREGDPHSPKVFGMWKVLFGNYFYYRRECDNRTTINKYTPDYKPDVIDRIIPFPGFGAYIGLVVFILMFGWTWGIGAWVFHIIGYLMLNSMINSLCHVIGYKNYDNGATNLQWVALMTGGEGLHNNHHEFPTSARFATKLGEIDPAWPFIKLLEIMRLADVNVVSLAKKAA